MLKKYLGIKANRTRCVWFQTLDKFHRDTAWRHDERLFVSRFQKVESNPGQADQITSV
jgi:hypothetical protein